MGAKHEKKPLDILREEKNKILKYINRHQGHSDFLAGYIELLKEYEKAIDVLCEWRNVKQREGALPIFDVSKMSLLSDDQLRILNDTYNRLLSEKPTKL